MSALAVTSERSSVVVVGGHLNVVSEVSTKTCKKTKGHVGTVCLSSRWILVLPRRSASAKRRGRSVELLSMWLQRSS